MISIMLIWDAGIFLEGALSGLQKTDFLPVQTDF